MKIDGHYQLPIHWKNIDAQLPNNYVMVISRLRSTVRRLEKQNLVQRYDSEINKLISSGYAEVVPLDQIHTAERVWYLPHHAVITYVYEPDKIRVGIIRQLSVPGQWRHIQGSCDAAYV